MTTDNKYQKIKEFQDRLLDIKLFVLVLRDAVRGNDEALHYEHFIEHIIDNIDALDDEMFKYSS